MTDFFFYNSEFGLSVGRIALAVCSISGKRNAIKLLFHTVPDTKKRGIVTITDLYFDPKGESAEGILTFVNGCASWCTETRILCTVPN